MLLRGSVAIAVVLVAAIAFAQGCAPQLGAVGPATPSAFATSRPPTPGVTITSSPNAIPPIPDGFRIQVARLRIDLPIAEGIVQRDIDRQQTPEGFAFHLPGTAIPGERGNTYIYSHARAGMFLALWSAQVGDEVVVLTPDGGRLKYVVTEVRPKVAPTDISVAQPTEDERLTLQTSTGPAPDDPRFVVIALIAR